MIRVNIVEHPAGRISSFTMDGHADFAEKGKDLVCAGASAVSFGALNSIIALTGAPLDIEQGEGGGFLHCSVPDNLPEETEEKVQLLLRGMVVSLQTIERDYGQYINITFQK
ncbi:MAG TPA: ribosomal-processing cysteine protease Prp [Chondromyces sp.]|nr:ribosomal-processing cysteine protease Prp [Chondromyces sp.]